jgi:hypothetical protein
MIFWNRGKAVSQKGIFLALPIDAKEIGGKFKRLISLEEVLFGGHHCPFPGPSL